MKKILITISAICISIFSIAQTATIQGNVKVNNSTDFSGINVHVRVDTYNEDAEAITFTNDVLTDANGNYTWSFDLYSNPLYPLYGNQYLDAVVTLTFSKATYQSDIISGVSVNTTPVTIDNMLLFPFGVDVYRPSICMVHYDTLTNIPNIIWDRETTENIKSYIVYKLVNQSWETLDTLDFSELSNFEDINADPTISSDYQIQAVLNDNSLSRYSEARKAPEIVLTTNGGVPQITWVNLNELSRINPAEITRVILFRSQTYHNWIPIDSVDVANVTEEELIERAGPFQDTHIPAEGVYNYRIGHRHLAPCTPAILKSESGPFILAMSNIAESENVPASINEVVSKASPIQVEIQNKTVSIQEKPGTTFEISNIAGSVIAKGNLNTPVHINLSQGMYIVSYTINGKQGAKKIVVK